LYTKITDIGQYLQALLTILEESAFWTTLYTWTHHRGTDKPHLRHDPLLL